MSLHLSVLAALCSVRGLGSCLRGRCPPCSPREIDDDVSPAFLHLGEGQRGHVAPDFQSFLDGPSHFSFYKLPGEPDDSEKQQALDEEHLQPIQAPSSKQRVQQIHPIGVGTLCPVGPEVSSQQSFADLCFSGAKWRGVSQACPPRASSPTEVPGSGVM